MEYLQTKGKMKGQLKRNFTNEEFEEIKKLTPWIKDETRKSIRERYYCIINKISEYPKCPVCGNDNIFLRSNKYSKTCSQSCGIKNPKCQKKTKATKLEKYGSETFVNSKKAIKTKNEKYGDDWGNLWAEKMKQVFLEKYGVESALQINGVVNKVKETCLEKYGVDNPSKSKKIKDKISIANSKHYQKMKINNFRGFVYILFFENINAYKIGVTVNFTKRQKGLLKDFGKFEIYNLIYTNRCFELEKKLHELNENERICLDEGCGRTEFFSSILNKRFTH